MEARIKFDNGEIIVKRERKSIVIDGDLDNGASFHFVIPEYYFDEFLKFINERVEEKKFWIFKFRKIRPGSFVILYKGEEGNVDVYIRVYERYLVFEFIPRNVLVDVVNILLNMNALRMIFIGKKGIETFIDEIKRICSK